MKNSSFHEKWDYVILHLASYFILCFVIPRADQDHEQPSRVLWWNTLRYLKQLPFPIRITNLSRAQEDVRLTSLVPPLLRRCFRGNQRDSATVDSSTLGNHWTRPGWVIVAAFLRENGGAAMGREVTRLAWGRRGGLRRGQVPGGGCTENIARESSKVQGAGKTSSLDPGVSYDGQPILHTLFYWHTLCAWNTLI